MAALYIIIGERTETGQRQSVSQVDGCLQVEIQVSIVVVVLDVQQRRGVANPRGLSHLVISARRIAPFREGGVEGR